MFINISYESYHTRKIYFGDFLCIFQICTLKIIAGALTPTIVLRSFSNMARTLIVLRPRTSSIMEVLLR